MKYRQLYILLLGFLMLLGCINHAAAQPAAAQGKPPKVKASAACLMDVATGQIYFQKEGDKRREPASLTKVMTAILAIENGNLKDVVTVKKRAAAVSMGQDIGLQTGDRLYLEDLLKAALMFSANDSTVAIGEHIAGDHDLFVQMMNDKALSLGMTNTRFANTNGFHHPNHYTTANDLAVLTSYALKNKIFAQMVSTEEAEISWLPKETDKPGANLEVTQNGEIVPLKTRTIHSTNRLLRSDFKGINGVKTGTTPRAGNCLIASATREGRQLVVVILNSDNRWNDATKLLDFGFNEVRPVVLVEKGELVTDLEVVDGVEKKINLVAAERVQIYTTSIELEKIKRKLKLEQAPTAPVSQGTRLGQLKFYLNDKEIASVDLVSSQEVGKISWIRKLLN